VAVGTPLTICGEPSPPRICHQALKLAVLAKHKSTTIRYSGLPDAGQFTIRDKLLQRRVFLRMFLDDRRRLPAGN
jgi:hypothetical protein